MEFRALLLAVFAAVPLVVPASAQGITREAIEKAERRDMRSEAPSPAIVKAMVLLDRAGFSPGVIDGFPGENFKKALRAYQREAGLPESGKLDEQTWTALTEDKEPILKTYRVTREDTEGPFLDKIPDELTEMAKLERVSYTSAREKIAEKFHMDGDFLGRLNRNASFDSSGTDIAIANVSRPGDQAVARVVIAKRERSLRAYKRSGDLVAFYPATVGSKERPAPSGTYEVKAVAKNPNYTYNPEFEFKGVKADKKIVVPPGPNGPVGSVWIGLTKEGYGIHGTADPSMVSKNSSHGCVRLTNWDAEQLAKMVKPGTKVEFVE